MRRGLEELGVCLTTCMLLLGSWVVTPGCRPSRPPATEEVAPQQSKGLASTQEGELTSVEPEPVSSPASEEAAQQEEEHLMKFEEANGYEIYERYCLVCHGADGDGVGFNAFNLNPRPRSFIDQYARERLTDEELARAISLGGAARNKSPLMPRWEHTLNGRQIRYVIAYIRLLQRKAQSAEAASEPGAQAPGAPRQQGRLGALGSKGLFRILLGR